MHYLYNMSDDSYRINFERLNSKEKMSLSDAAYSGDYHTIKALIRKHNLLGECSSCFYTSQLAYNYLCKIQELKLI